MLSKLPVHNLAKKGRVDIQILKQGLNGQVELKWEVSYSDRYGQARQLAYKLDTIVIDRAIDQAGKPLPERLKLRKSPGNFRSSLGSLKAARTSSF